MWYIIITQIFQTALFFWLSEFYSWKLMEYQIYIIGEQIHHGQYLRELDLNRFLLDVYWHVQHACNFALFWFIAIVFIAICDFIWFICAFPPGFLHLHLHNRMLAQHDDVIKWKHIPRYWPFVRGIHRSPVNSPHKVQWRGALVFFFYLGLNKRLSKQW